jgi:hypothetical protein
MMKTLPLDWETWDLKLDPAGNLSAVDSVEGVPGQADVSGEAFYCAQTVANACRLFKNDAYFFQDRGIPYFETVLGFRPPESLVRAYLMEAAMNVPLVVNAKVLNYEITDRTIKAQLMVYTENGSKFDVFV